VRQIGAARVALDQVLESQEIVAGGAFCQSPASVSMVQDAVSPSGVLFGRGNGRGEPIQPAELPQFGSEHAVVLRKGPRGSYPCT